MISRRDVALGGLLTIGWLATPCGCCAAASAREARGCILSDEDADKFLAAESKPAPTDHVNPTFVSSGDRDLDYAVAQTLSRLTDVWNVLPGFAWFDDYSGPNAFFTPRKFFDRADGSVIFGRRQLARCLKDKDAPDAAIAATCAHEFGHVTQYKRGLHRQLLEGQPTSKRLELHADFLAGYFAGLRKRERPDFPATVFANTRYNRGDFNSTAKSHHGTPDERAGACVKGFEAGFRDRCSPGEALQVGLRYVQTL